MRSLVFAALLALTPVTQARAPATVGGFETAILSTQVDGMIEINPTGTVRSYTMTPLDSPLPDAVVERLERQVRAWTFEPVLVNGTPVLARTAMRVTLVAKAHDDGYSISIENVTFPTRTGVVADGAPPERQLRVRKTSRLQYPDELAMRGLDASVLVAVQFAADGTLKDAAVVQSSIPDRTGKPEEFRRLATQLERAVLKGVRGMTLELDTPPGAESSEPFTGMLPVIFQMSDSAAPRKPQTGKWRVERRSDKRVPPWQAPDARIAGVSDLNEGETTSGRAGPRLITQVWGSEI